MKSKFGKNNMGSSLNLAFPEGVHYASGIRQWLVRVKVGNNITTLAKRKKEKDAIAIYNEYLKTNQL